ncbi:C40 family peptidase [Alicyclobacillus macrosporangiidus]|uniref:C40 family peptidase n=1 Tax=Alicyclobacillus macrosporangiidus TaxID=392015 RepID=UPI00068CC9EA|nr:C40 family peptidase [Alicyclobacillus macrosporangiidus]
MKHRIWMAVAASSMLCLTMAVPASEANELTQKQAQMQALQAQAAQVNQQAAADQAKAQQLQQAIQSYSDSIAAVQQQADANAKEIAALNQQLKALQDRIAKTQQELDQDQQRLQDSVRAVYEDGTVSYLEVLFHSTSFSDLLDRMDALARIADQQRQLAAQVRALRDSLQREQQTKAATVQTLQKKQHEYELLIETNRQLREQKKRAYSDAMARVHADVQKKGMLESQIRLTQEQIAAIEAQTRQAEAKMQDASYVAQATQSLASADSSAIIHYAEQFIGTPYVWGGTSPGGFDCSGFTQYVFGHFGVHLGRTAADQFGQGVPVSQANLQPGDLVFFSTYAPGATHVGIYIGGGMMINAEDAGCMITSIHSSYWGPRYIGARRVIKG